MHALRALARARLTMGLPLLGICLGHQILSLAIGLEVEQLAEPDQGRAREIDLFGTSYRVGFYNSYAVSVPDRPIGGVELAPAEGGRHINALRGHRLAGLQFHPESILTTDGSLILAAELYRLKGLGV